MNIYCMNLLILFIFVVFLELNFATKLDHVSFSPPFQKVDGQGKRMVSDYIDHHGSSVVNQHFIRLTPDRQSRKGALWGRSKIDSDTLNAILKFRISGQGKTFYGDGIAIWITSNKNWIEGDFHGSKEKFQGIAIIMDTFKNSEYAFAHRDITVLVNDGEKSYEMMTDDIVGCDVNVRYHNARADFSVTDASRVYLSIDDNNSLDIQVDARNNNNWMDCVHLNRLPFLNKGWLKDAYIGITASTGSLADNHDILSFQAFTTTTEGDVEKDKRDIKSATDTNSLSSQSQGDHFDTSKMSDIGRIELLEKRLSASLQRFADFDLHLEHELASVTEHVEHMINQIANRENKAESRLEEIEEFMREQMYGGSSSGGGGEHQWYALEEVMENKLQEHVDESLKTMTEGLGKLKDQADQAQGWKIPMFSLILLCVGVFGWMYYEYNKRRKWGHLG